MSVREFPTFLGDPLHVRIDGGPLLHSAEAFRLRLRCVDEAWVERTGQRKGVDYRGAFVLPVYARA